MILVLAQKLGITQFIIKSFFRNNYSNGMFIMSQVQGNIKCYALHMRHDSCHIHDAFAV